MPATVETYIWEGIGTLVLTPPALTNPPGKVFWHTQAIPNVPDAMFREGFGDSRIRAVKDTLAFIEDQPELHAQVKELVQQLKHDELLAA